MSTVKELNTVASMSPTDGGGCRPPGERPLPQLQTQRTADPRTSIEDYSRVMLEYTQHRMANFTDLDDDKGSSRSRSSRGSETSGKSGDSSSTGLSKNSSDSTSAGINHHDFAVSGDRAEPSAKTSRSTHLC
ncbi:hypothetical protein BDV59DRAFT_12123 [Aspergillus ambiguus]|uniref:uncharacterized protein n=1 Tax=Aspergillus ambiguus TaxID=176160 RepID=UPI003CCC9DD7